jgi:hypothetical protein
MIDFENYDYIFTEFIDYFDEIKKRGNEYKTFGKLIINSLYGRLGMNYIDTHSFITDKSKFDFYLNNLNVIKHIELNEIVLLEVEIDDKFYNKFPNIKRKSNKTNIQLASAITSKARISLYKAQQSVINNNGRLLYSDTDSIIAAYSKNVDNQKHGEIF